MEIKIIDEVTYLVNKKKIINNFIFLFIVLIISSLSIFLLFYFDNRSLYKLFTFLSSLIATIGFSLILYIIRVNLVSLFYFKEVIKNAIYRPNEIVIGKVIKNEGISYLNKIECYKFIILSEEKEIEIYLPSFIIYQIEVGNTYEFKLSNSFVVSFKD